MSAKNNAFASVVAYVDGGIADIRNFIDRVAKPMSHMFSDLEVILVDDASGIKAVTEDLSGMGEVSFSVL
ncbi:MAG: hypothetical protein K6E19_01290, partial [Lachnospiraceae bacterium]|nr:hypothetical protein [Lachnospiraceae bacterium]